MCQAPSSSWGKDPCETEVPGEITVSGDSVSVQVGSAAHPMEEAHHIAFVYVETARGGQRKCLKPSEAPALMFRFADDTPVAVHAYCNIHGLWKTEIR